MPESRLSDLAREFPGYDADSVSVSVAQQLIRSYILPITETETLPLKLALGRVLASDVVSFINVPAHDNSAMDGYAFRGSDLGDQSCTLHIVGVAYAGRPYNRPVNPGACVRIMTGAVMPEGCDTVMPSEFVLSETDTQVTLPAGKIRAGDNRRLAGEDLAMGSAAVNEGKILTPADLGLIASLGIGEVSVRRKLRVAYFSTGDELRSPGELLDEGCVYDSNGYTLHGMLLRMGCEPIDMGVIKDEPASLETALRRACVDADVVITSGGVSAGDADYTRKMMMRLGDVLFWKIDMRPGRPMAFGRITSGNDSALLFGLPGNPVATMVSFYFFAREALYRLMGADPPDVLTVRVTSSQNLRKKPGRTEYQRGIFSVDAQGLQSVRITGSQGSGILSSMSEANCMVILHHDQGDVKAGDSVDVMLFQGLL
ncbi:MAG: molybdopterin biosynthesis protein MoeA [Pseudomonadota bacterium]